MTGRRNKTARKAPRQARSQATVGAILEATIRILDQEGEEAATTTRMSEVAGVSVGTLYQWFPDRNAVFDALEERELSRTLAFIETVLSDPGEQPTPRKIVTRIVRGLAEQYAAAKELHRYLVIRGLQVGRVDRVHTFDARVTNIVRHFLQTMGSDARRQNSDAAAFITFQSVRASMLAALLERPPGLDLDVLEEELVDLLLRYLVDQEE